jgi:Domain of unknown function (DUF4411)
MNGKAFFSIDTSALIHWWCEDYTPEVFPSLLPLLEGLVAESRLRAARSVKDELADGQLRDWCQNQAEFFVDEDEAIQLRVKQLMAAYQNPKKARGIGKADPFVIALAATQEGEWHVVSAEAGGSLAKNPNIPTVCGAIGVKHIRFFDMLRKEGWQL